MGKQRVVVEDVVSDPLFRNTKDRKVMLQASVRACQSTPLLNMSGDVVGVISTHYRTPGRPSDRALKALDLLAWHAADLIGKIRHSEELERVVAEGTLELEKRNASLQIQAEKVRQLSSQLLTAQDEERRRIARELHDTTGQELASVTMNLIPIEQFK
jgi:signal transduction histidine kinase